MPVSYTSPFMAQNLSFYSSMKKKNMNKPSNVQERFRLILTLAGTVLDWTAHAGSDMNSLDGAL